MAFYDKFPYTNFHELNLDWIIKEFPKVYASRDEAQASAEASAKSAAASQLSAEASKTSAEDSQESADAAALSEKNVANIRTVLENDVDAIDDRVDNINARLNNLEIQGTPTEGNAELIDIRVAFNNKKWDTAGDSVRGQASLLNGFIEDITVNEPRYTDITSTLETIGDGYYNNPLVMKISQWLSNENTRTFRLSVKAGDRFKVQSYAYYECKTYFLYDPVTNTVSAAEPETGNKTFHEYEITIPVDGYLYVGTWLSRLSAMKVERITDSKLVDGTKIVNLEIANRLKGKTALFFGDSICHGTSVGNQSPYYGWGWAGRIGEANNMTWHNLGISGRTVIYNQTGESNDVVVAHNTYPDADYIILEACLNDGFQSVTKGTILPGYDVAFDPTASYCDAFQYMLQQVYTLYPEARIGVIIPPQVKTKRIGEYQELAREICKKWSVPIIDLYYDSGMCVEIPQQASLYYSDGQTHLTDAGYDMITPKIENWMKAL